jgi:hypothetical protein
MHTNIVFGDIRFVSLLPWNGQRYEMALLDAQHQDLGGGGGGGEL